MLLSIAQHNEQRFWNVNPDLIYNTKVNTIEITDPISEIDFGWHILVTLLIRLNKLVKYSTSLEAADGVTTFVWLNVFFQGPTSKSNAIVARMILYINDLRYQASFAAQ